MGLREDLALALAPNLSKVLDHTERALAAAIDEQASADVVDNLHAAYRLLAGKPYPRIR